MDLQKCGRKTQYFFVCHVCTMRWREVVLRLHFARVRFPNFEQETGYSVLAIHRHSSYSEEDQDARYDIVLLRINSSATAKGYVSPILLPVSQGNPKVEQLCTSAPPLGGMYRNPEWCKGQTSSLWATLNATGCTIDFFLSKSAPLIKKTNLISAPVTPEHHLRKVEQLCTIAGGKPYPARQSNY